MTQPGLSDIEFRLDDLSKIGDPLVFLNETIEWDEFDEILRIARARDRERRGASNRSGRKPFSLRVMFKVLVLQSLYDRSDDRLEFMIKDRLSSMRCLGLKMEDARWGSRHGTPTFGYKAHAAVDNKNKMIRHIENDSGKRS